jgi:2-dehydro-3-deoxygalactonokinase
MPNFLSCDWGTSSFRLRFAESATLKIYSVEDHRLGMANCFDQWKQSGKDEQERFVFYRGIIDRHIQKLQEQVNTSFQHLPIVISGMASSSLGMVLLPYKKTPFNADGSDLIVKKFSASDEFPHEIIIISGAKSSNDVMRGEETQLAGCDHSISEQQIFILPGTHSKHIFVKDGRVVDFKTYMTGEFFDLLCKKSILSASVEKGEGIHDKNNMEIFEAGVKAAGESSLLHSSFLVRTNTLFDKITPAENYYYLSGLLISTELNDLKAYLETKITLVVNEAMKPYYESALNILGNSDVTIRDADEALILGQRRICNHYVG